MHRTNRIAGCGTFAILWAATRAVACDGLACSPSTCVAPERFSLAPAATSATTATTGGARTLGLTRTPPPPSTLATTTVHVYNFDFSINPSGQPVVDATINVGDSIHWVWDGGFHSATSVAGSAETFNSGDMFSGSFDHTFTLAGVFWYFCDIHGFDNGDGTASGMSGTITVLAPSSSWNVDFDGSWNTSTNWNNNTVPNAAGYVANLGPVISGPRGVNVDSSVTVGTLNLDSPSPKSYLLAGGATMSLAGASGAPTGINVLSGSHTITTKLSIVNDVTINVAQSASTLTMTQLQSTSAAVTKSGAGKLVVNNVRSGALSVSGGTLSVQSNGTSSGTSRVSTLALAGAKSPPTATMDLTNNDLIVTGTALSSVQAMIVAARNGGAWNQQGLTSSTAAADSNHATSLGLMSGVDYKSANGATATFDGFSVANSDVLVKYTYYGDSDFNGKVDGADYARIDTTFNNESATHTDIGGWLNGDFDYNGKVDGADYALIDGSFNSQSGTLRPSVGYFDFVGPAAPPPMSSVPEPALLGLSAVAAITFLARRRWRRRGGP